MSYASGFFAKATLQYVLLMDVQRLEFFSIHQMFRAFLEYFVVGYACLEWNKVCISDCVLRGPCCSEQSLL